MTEANLSAYEKFIIESAERYLQTVVLIDDRIYENGKGSVTPRLTKPSATRRKSALKSAASSADRNERFEKAEIAEEPDEVSFHDVQNSFAKKRIICSLYQPKKSASFGRQFEVYKLCSTADAVIVDWDLEGNWGDKATRLVGNLVEQSRVEIPYQLRLVFIYTREPNLQSVADILYDDLSKRLSQDDIDVDPDSEGLVLTTNNTRVVVLGKRPNTSLPQFSNFRVPESDLAARTIREFSNLASGLLQGVVLRGMAKLRENSRRILSRFHKDLDIAFLAHRALLLPDETFCQLIPLLTDELRAVLEDTLGESPLGKTQSIGQILPDWCDKYLRPGSEAEQNTNDSENDLRFVKDVFFNGLDLQNKHIKFCGSKISKLIKNENPESPRWTTLGYDKLAEYTRVNHCHEKLGSLMSQRIKYGKFRKSLHLGVIVRELADENRFLLCLQPVCDSVRLGGKNRAFIFCVLKKSKGGKRFTHCVVDGKDNVIKLEYKSKIPGVFVSNFKGNNDAVYAKEDAGGRFIFTGEEGKEYEWIAELKTEHAQRAAEQFGRELSRVGLTESEWLRIKAK